MPHRFTLEEAEGLLPEVERLIRDAIERKSALEEAQSQFQSFVQRVMTSGGMIVDRSRVLAMRAARDRAAEDLRLAIERIQEQGCLVKDLDIGLVDFPTLYRGREVLLCWKLGEAGITHWHGTDEGFAGRKPIDDDFLREHRGDRSH